MEGYQKQVLLKVKSFMGESSLIKKHFIKEGTLETLVLRGIWMWKTPSEAYEPTSAAMRLVASRLVQQSDEHDLSDSHTPGRNRLQSCGSSHMFVEGKKGFEWLSLSSSFPQEQTPGERLDSLTDVL